MLKVKTMMQRFIEEANKNKQTVSKTDKLAADLDYIAMMCDVKLEEEALSDEQVSQG